MKNCIFVCTFNNEKYITMFYLLLESIYLYGNINDETDILLYTSTEFMNIIKQSNWYSEKIKFETNDTYTNIDKACKSRLDIFQLESISEYQRILYLDTDIIVKGDINKIFECCKEEVLYALEEGNIVNDISDYWGGKTLFGDEVHNYEDTSAFTSGILLFQNCEKIKTLFEKICKDIIDRPHTFASYDQPYIVYNAFKYNLYNNKSVKAFVVNNDHNIYTDKIIHHFPGGPGYYGHKLAHMTLFLNGLKGYDANVEQICTDNTIKEIEHKKYTWCSEHITFLENCRMDAFGEGHYKYIDKYTILAFFGERMHSLSFNDDYTHFISIRGYDLEIVHGDII